MFHNGARVSISEPGYVLKTNPRASARAQLLWEVEEKEKPKLASVSPCALLDLDRLMIKTLAHEDAHHNDDDDDDDDDDNRDGGQLHIV